MDAVKLFPSFCKFEMGVNFCLDPEIQDNKQSLNWTNLAALRPAGDDVSISKYAKNGMSAKRIRQVLKNKESSGCNCKNKSLGVSVRTPIRQMCVLFWV